MRTVYKYPLIVHEEQELMLPKGAQILSVANQNDSLVLYALVDAEKTEREAYTIYIRGTGHPMYHLGVFIGTVSMFGGKLMLHVFVG